MRDSVNDNLEDCQPWPQKTNTKSRGSVELEDAAQELRYILGADGYAVCRVNRFAPNVQNRTTVVFSSIDRQMRLSLPALSDAIELHMERSLLPFRWPVEINGLPDGDGFVDILPISGIGSAGVGFPVKLGIMGNGFVLFFGRDLDISGDRAVEFHGDAYRIMRELLALDVQKFAPQQSLNDRELQCLQLAADGYKSEGIAEDLGLSVHTVNAYLGFAASKLDAVNRIQAIAKAIRLGLIG